MEKKRSYGKRKNEGRYYETHAKLEAIKRQKQSSDDDSSDQEKEKLDNGKSLQNEFPMKVGKASATDPVIKQPRAAEIGLVPKVPFRLLASGPSNSGKTNATRWILDKYYCVTPKKSFFDRIYVLSPTAKMDPAWDKMTGIREGDKITVSGADAGKMLHAIFSRNKKRAKTMTRSKAPHELIIIDDSIADVKLMNSEGLLTSSIAGRHANQSFIFMGQSYNKCPRPIRLQMSALMMFPSKTSEIERLFVEHGPLHLNKKEFIAMVQFATKKDGENKWPFLFINTDEPEETRFRRNLDTVLRIDQNRNVLDSGNSKLGKRKNAEPDTFKEEDLNTSETDSSESEVPDAKSQKTTNKTSAQETRHLLKPRRRKSKDQANPICRPPF
jgi:hypothetical protein